MKSKGNSGIKQLFFTVALSIIALPCFAADALYPVQVPGKYPKPFAAYKKIIPPAWKKAAWVYALQGTAEPVRTIDLKGRKFLFGHVCKPHDCGGNQLTFLIALDGSEAFAFANSFDLTGTKDVAVGDPDPETLKLLKKGLD